MCRNLLKYVTGSLALALLGWTMTASAQAPGSPSNTQFDITGVVQEATLDNTASPTSGGTLLVNGQRIIVPANTIVQYPVRNSSWFDVFRTAPAPYGIVGKTAMCGMAKADKPAPLTFWEVNVQGNRVINALGDFYIAGMVTFSQEATNAGQGFINYIDYTKGEIRVGGVMGDKTTGARVRINDSKGTFGLAHSPDPRFSCDASNPTIRSETGYPMGLPRTDPAKAIDKLCPFTNRPKDASGVYLTYIDPNVTTFNPKLDPNSEAPMEVGDYINFSGTLVADPVNASGVSIFPNGTTQTQGAGFPADNTFISAHTIISNVAIYTLAGQVPAYVAIDVTILGTGGQGKAGVTEATARTRFEGFSTDPTRNVFLYGMDLATNGSETDRAWGSIDVDQGAPTGAVRGRWRFRPPVKFLTGPANGAFDPPTREVRAVVMGRQGVAFDTSNPAWKFGSKATNANGIIYGQANAPIGEYLFPEQVPGSPIPPDNFETFAWLFNGGQIDPSTNKPVGPLNPWPGFQQVVVPPAPGAVKDIVVITGATQRPLPGKNRLDITAQTDQTLGTVGAPNVILTCTTKGATINVTNAQMAFTPAVTDINGNITSAAFFTISFIGTGWDATSVTVTSSSGGTATLAKPNAPWKVVLH